jgi:hypothetical protein
VTTAHAVGLLIVVELLIRWVPLPRLAASLGVRVNLGPARPGAERLPVELLSARARRELRCTRRVADVWPLSKGPYVRRSLAHAWLEIDDRPLENVDGFGVFQHASAGTTA